MTHSSWTTWAIQRGEVRGFAADEYDKRLSLGRRVLRRQTGTQTRGMVAKLLT